MKNIPFEWDLGMVGFTVPGSTGVVEDTGLVAYGDCYCFPDSSIDFIYSYGDKLRRIYLRNPDFGLKRVFKFCEKKGIQLNHVPTGSAIPDGCSYLYVSNCEHHGYQLGVVANISTLDLGF